MAAMTMEPDLSRLQRPSKASEHKPQVVEEIEGLIKVYNDGHVERPEIVPSVGCSLASDLGVTCRDAIIDKYTNIWARIYVPTAAKKLPLLVYFHGGGFCVGAASWSCYHEFLAKLAAKAGCTVVSVNYRLAPEHRLPAAYDDGFKAAIWAKQQEVSGDSEWWAGKCDFSRISLAGDSAGANIAYNVGLRVNSIGFGVKGLVLIQPFFGGEGRTRSEMCMAQPPRSALTLAASDAYWRMALPAGAGRNHPWCNAGSAAELRWEGPAVMVCVAEADILRDRNLEFSGGLAREGVRVEQVVSKGVGHAFQILNKSSLAQTRLHELLSHVKNFVGR